MSGGHDSYQAYGSLLGQVYADEVPDMVSMTALSFADGSPVLYAADAQGHRHLLVPVTDDHVVVEESGDSLDIRKYHHPDTGGGHLDLVCTSDRLAGVFATLVDSALERIGDNAADAAITVKGVVSEWRKLLRSAGSLSEDAERGLFGELSVLARLAETNPHHAVKSWRGPLNDPHDFSTVRGDLEVKTTAGDALTVVVSSLAQLDPPKDVPLTLIQVRVRNSPTGTTIAQAVEALVDRNVPRSELTDRLVKAGYLPGETADEHRFELVGCTAWNVTSDFPGLRESDLPEGRSDAITRVSYTLDLNGAPGRLNDDELTHQLNWVMTA